MVDHQKEVLVGVINNEENVEQAKESFVGLKQMKAKAKSLLLKLRGIC